jgi:hypothetical protein
MATSMVCLVVLCIVSPLLLAGAVHGNPSYGSGLFPQFYDRSCPKAKEIVHSIVAQAVARETRMAMRTMSLMKTSFIKRLQTINKNRKKNKRNRDADHPTIAFISVHAKRHFICKE